MSATPRVENQPLRRRAGWWPTTSCAGLLFASCVAAAWLGGSWRVGLFGQHVLPELARRLHAHQHRSPSHHHQGTNHQSNEAGQTADEGDADRRLDSFEQSVVKAALPTTQDKTLSSSVLTSSNGHLQLGVFVKLLKPQEMQPYYLMPIANGLQVAIAFAITGFELNFKHKDEEEPMGVKKVARDAMELAGGLTLIFGSLNGWFCDIQQFAKLPTSSFLEHLLAIAVIAVSSPNYAQAIAICTPRILQSPATLLNATPRYKAGIYGIPLEVGRSFLHWTTHVAALVLLPYFSMRIVLKLLVTTLVGFVRRFLDVAALLVCMFFVGLVLSYFFKPAALIYQATLALTLPFLKIALALGWFEVRAVALLLVSLAGVMFTLGMNSYARSCLLYFWEIDWPPVYFLAVQLWATLVVPALLTLLFAGVKRAKDAFDRLREEKLPINSQFFKSWYAEYKPIPRDSLRGDQLWNGIMNLALAPLSMDPYDVRTMRRLNPGKRKYFDFTHDFEGFQKTVDENESWMNQVRHQHELKRKERGAFWKKSWKCRGCSRTEASMDAMFRCELDACKFALCQACHARKTSLAAIAEKAQALQNPNAKKLLCERPDELQEWLSSVQHHHKLETVRQGWFWRSSWKCAGCSCSEKEMGTYMHRCNECKFALCDACHTKRTDAEKLEERAEAEEAAELQGAEQVEENLERMQCTIVQLTLMSISLIALEQLVWFATARFVIWLYGRMQETTMEDDILGLISVIRMTICERTFVSYVKGVIDTSEKSFSDMVQLAWSVL